MRQLTLTPTWAETAKMLVTILESSTNPESIAFARNEIVRMGRIIDDFQKVAEQEPTKEGTDE